MMKDARKRVTAKLGKKCPEIALRHSWTTVESMGGQAVSEYWMSVGVGI